MGFEYHKFQNGVHMPEVEATREGAPRGYVRIRHRDWLPDQWQTITLSDFRTFTHVWMSKLGGSFTWLENSSKKIVRQTMTRSQNRAVGR